MINSPFYKNQDKFGKLGPNPSSKSGLVHFLLGAMLPCSTPFSTSASKGPLDTNEGAIFDLLLLYTICCLVYHMQTFGAKFQKLSQISGFQNHAILRFRLTLMCENFHSLIDFVATGLSFYVQAQFY